MPPPEPTDALASPPAPGLLARAWRLWFPRLELTPLGRRTFHWHLAAAFFESIHWGIMSISGYLMRRQLEATDFQVTLFFALPVMMLVFSTAGASFVSFRNHRWFILATGCLGPLSLGALLFNQEPFFFIGICAWIQLNLALFLPAQNIIFRSNYAKRNRGACYSRAKIVALLTTCVTAKTVGWVLDRNPDVFAYLFLLGGASAFTAYMLYFAMPLDPARASPPATRGRPSLLREFATILREDRLFRRYEVYFFLYGCGFMITMAMLPLFVNDVLQADYAQASSVFGFIHPLTMVVALPLFAHLLDRKDVLLVAALAYLLLAGWPLTLAIGRTMPAAYVAMVFFGLGISGVDIAWNLGAMSFAREDRIQAYHAVHVSLVGLRAIFAPFLGLLVKRHLGFGAAFALSAGLFLLAATLMLSLERQRRRDGAAVE